MKTLINSDEVDLGLPERYKIKPNRRPVKLDNLIEMGDFRIVGQEGGMILVEVELDINKERYLFIGPLQVVKMPEVKEQAGPYIVNLLNLDKE